MSSEQQHGRVLQRAKHAVAFVAFSAVFGPFLLYDPPLFGGYTRREWLMLGIGFVTWGIVLEGVFGVGTALSELMYP